MNTQDDDQYSLVKITMIWVAAAGPMAILGFLVGPWLAPQLNVDPKLQTGVARIVVLTIGLVWQFVLSLIIVRSEMGDLSWYSMKTRLWLNAPTDPRTGHQGGKVWLQYIPFFLLLGLFQFILPLIDSFIQQIPFFEVREEFDPGNLLSDPVVQDLLVGQWWFFFLFVVMLFFNTVVGEEFLFRGVLLPKMNGTFGRWDWVANGILMGAYHWHQPWTIPNAIITSVFVFSLASKRYKSTWMGIALHSVQSVLITFLVLSLMLGLA